MFSFRSEHGEWYCKACWKFATEEHCKSDGHQKKKYWAVQSLQSESDVLHPGPERKPECTMHPRWTRHECPNTHRPFYHCKELGKSSWNEPPSWFEAWLQQVRQAGYLTPEIIFNICGGPDLESLAPPPPIEAFADVRSCLLYTSPSPRD